MTRRMVTVLGLAALVGGGAACGGDDGGGVAAEPVPDDPDVVVVAEDMAFDPRKVEVPADTPVSIVIDNRDEGVDHNIHVEEAPEPNRTQLEEGVSRQALTVTLAPGEYEFVCDIHPAMTGTMEAR